MRHYDVKLVAGGKTVFSRPVETKGGPDRAVRTTLSDYSKNTKKKNISVTAVVYDKDFKRTKKYSVSKHKLAKAKTIRLSNGSDFIVRYDTRVKSLGGKRGSTKRSSKRSKRRSSKKSRRSSRRRSSSRRGQRSRR